MVVEPPPSPPVAVPASGALSMLATAASDGVPIGVPVSVDGCIMPPLPVGSGVVVMASIAEPPGEPPVEPLPLPGVSLFPAEQAAKQRRNERLK